MIMRILVLGLLIAAMPASAEYEQERRPDVFTVYYIPLDVHFYIPVTSKDIEKRAALIFNVESIAIARLFHIIADADSNLDKPLGLERLIRIKIVRCSDNEALFISQERDVYDSIGIKLVSRETINDLISEIEARVINDDNSTTTQRQLVF